MPLQVSNMLQQLLNVLMCFYREMLLVFLALEEATNESFDVIHHTISE